MRRHGPSALFPLLVISVLAAHPTPARAEHVSAPSDVTILNGLIWCDEVAVTPASTAVPEAGALVLLGAVGAALTLGAFGRSGRCRPGESPGEPSEGSCGS